jgi:hypothetical protein
MNKLLSKWKMAGKGLRQLYRQPRYWAITALATLVFIFILNLLNVGNTFLQLLINLPLGEKFSVVGQVYANFFVGLWSLDHILMLLISLGQGVIISALVYVWKSKRALDDTAVLESGGATLIALLGAGCPLCGGSVLLPYLILIFGTSAMALLQTISTVLIILAAVPLVFALRRLGFMCYTYSAQKSARAKKEPIDGKS